MRKQISDLLIKQLTVAHLEFFGFEISDFFLYAGVLEISQIIK